MHSANPDRIRPGWKVSLGVVLALLLFIVVLAQWGAITQRIAHDLTLAIPYLVSRDMALYRDTFSYHPPQIVWLLSAVYRHFDPITGLRLLNVGYILLTSGLIAWAAKRIWGLPQALMTWVVYSLWSIYYNDLFFYVDGLVGTVAACVLILATFRRSWWNLAAIGLLAGSAAALKQSALLLAILPTAWAYWEARHRRDRALRSAALVLSTSAVGLLLPFVVLALSGTWAEASAGLFNPGNSQWLYNLRVMFNGEAWRAMLVTLAPLLLFAVMAWGDPQRHSFSLLTGLVFVSTFLLNFPAPGYYHFMATLPPVALMTGAALATVLGNAYAVLTKQKQPPLIDSAQLLPRAVFSGAAGYGLIVLVFAFTPLMQVFLGGGTIVGWDELRPVSQWLRSNTLSDERILIMPTYDTNGNIYAQAERLPPFFIKTWSYHARIPDNLERLQVRIEADPPSVIVFFADLFEPVASYFANFRQFLDLHYERLETLEPLPLYGQVEIYRLK